MVDWVFPEDAGTGGHDAGGDFDDAANFASAFHAIGQVDYVASDLAVDEVDRPTVDAPEINIPAFKAVLTDSTLVGAQSGQTRRDVAFVAEVDERNSVSLTDATVNHVYVTVDLDTNDTPAIEVNTTGSAPASPSLKILEVDTNDDSIEPVNQQSRPASASIGGAITEGRVFSDAGTVHDTIQGAVNSATAYVFVGPGTFAENVLVDENGLVVTGMNGETLIDGGVSGDALRVSGSNVTVRDLNVRTDPGLGEDYTALRVTDGSSDVLAENIRVTESDLSGIDLRGGEGHRVVQCAVDACDNNAFIARAAAEYVTFAACQVIRGDAVGLDGFNISASHAHVLGCHVADVSRNGIWYTGDANSGTATGNLARLCGSDGIRDDGFNNVIRGNRTQGNDGQNYNVANRTLSATVTDGNYVG